MLKIAVTGGIGSGKSTVVKDLQSRHCMSSSIFLNVDDMVHKMYASKYYQRLMISLFGTFERSEVAKVFFDDPLKQKIAEFSSAAQILIDLGEAFEENKDAPFVIVEVPLLFEFNMQEVFDRVICVNANDDVRVSRIVSRNNCTKQKAISLMARQMSLSEKALKSDFVVLNNRNDASNLIEEVTRAKEWLLRQA